MFPLKGKKYIQGKEIFWCLGLENNERPQKQRHDRLWSPLSRHQRSAQKKSPGPAPFYHHRQLTLAGSPPLSLCTAVLASSGSALALIWKAKDKLHFFSKESWENYFYSCYHCHWSVWLACNLLDHLSTNFLPFTHTENSHPRRAASLRYQNPSSLTGCCTATFVCKVLTSSPQ